MVRMLLRTVFAARWQPGQDTLLAVSTALLMIPTYYVGSHDTSGVWGLVVFVILGNGILNVLLPACYVLVVRREHPRELGITRDRLWLAVGLSLLVGTMNWFGLQKEALRHPDAHLLPQLIFNGLILWEPLFVYGWLQLRFERAFGIVPGIALAAMSFGAYHLGTYPLPAVETLVVIGAFYGILFRTTRNLLTVWPLVWSITSSIGTLQGGFSFAGHDIAIYAILLVIQIVAIAWMIGGSQSRHH